MWVGECRCGISVHVGRGRCVGRCARACAYVCVCVCVCVTAAHSHCRILRRVRISLGCLSHRTS